MRDGFEAARIEDIAAASGHTRGAFYANFETKEDLFLALLEQQSVKPVTELHVISPAVQDSGRRCESAPVLAI